MINSLFYKFVKIEPENVRDRVYQKCLSLDFLGTVLIAKEGVNGNVSGTEENITKFQLFMQELFGDITFKDAFTPTHNFKKLKVRIRPETITLAQDLNIDDAGEYIEPEELKKRLDANEDVVMVDMRNQFEYDIGRFENAIKVQMDTFRELPDATKKLQHIKDKTIVTYCTGGIRCEKASAYLRKQGFKDVKQLHGGIITYGQRCGDAYWEGKCFVFDDRVAVDLGKENDLSTIKLVLQRALETDEFDFLKSAIPMYKDFVAEQCDDELTAIYQKCEAALN